jgi:hypothetical protein
MSEEQKKETEKQPTEKEIYDNEFEKAANGAEVPKTGIEQKKSEDPNKTTEPPTGDDKSKTDSDADKDKAKEKGKEYVPPTDQPKEGDDKKKEEGEKVKSEHHGKLESVEKALKDTQGYATRLAQKMKEIRVKNNELKKQIAEQDKKGEPQITDSDLSIDEEKLKKTYEDYPDLKPVLDPIVKTNKALIKKIQERNKEISDSNSKETDKTEAETAQKDAKDYYANVTKPGIEKVHPDYEKLINDKFWAWLETQSEAIKAASKSPDPRDGILLINAYKEHLGIQTKEKESAQKKTTTDVTNNLPPSSSANSTPPFDKKVKSGDYDEEFDKIADSYKG